jgi:hypothetical protein
MYKLIFIAFIGIVTNLPAQAPGRYAKGDRLYVWASQLNIRSQPASNASVIGKVAYGRSVEIADDSLFQHPFAFAAIKKHVERDTTTYYEDRVVSPQTVISKPHLQIDSTVSPELKLNGYWVKVRYGDVIGYVFDGYLSRIPTIGQSWPQGGYMMEGFDKWAQHTLKLKTKVVDFQGSSECHYTEYAMPGGPIKIQHGTRPPECVGCGFTEIVLTGFSYEEGLMLALQIFEGHYARASKDHYAEFSDSPEFYTCVVTVKVVKNKIVIHRECCC